MRILFSSLTLKATFSHRSLGTGRVLYGKTPATMAFLLSFIYPGKSLTEIKISVSREIWPTGQPKLTRYAAHNNITRKEPNTKYRQVITNMQSYGIIISRSGPADSFGPNSLKAPWTSMTFRGEKLKG